jgi:hypothetical protein
MKELSIPTALSLKNNEGVTVSRVVPLLLPLLHEQAEYSLIENRFQFQLEKA